MEKRGFSLVELVIVIAIILIIVGIAIPYGMSLRMNAAEIAVIREVQTIHQAQTQFVSQFGRYASTLTELGPGVSAARLIPASLASGEKNGYVFSMALTPAGYSVNANPKVFGSTGRRTFYLDQDGIVHQNWGRESASANSPEAM